LFCVTGKLQARNRDITGEITGVAKRGPRRLQHPGFDEISHQRRRRLLAGIEGAIEGSAEVERINAEAAEEGGL
jgi:hypothetical protein